MTPRKDLLDIQSLTDEELDFILSNAVPFKNLFKRSVKKVPALRGKTIVNLSRAFLDTISAAWDRALDRLRHLVEDPPSATKEKSRRASARCFRRRRPTPPS